ncbi:MAG: hypothetical protein ACREEY_12355 [Brevundimonas sp.]
MRVRFLRDRNWTPPERRMITVAYKAGMELTVRRAWGEQMVADGDAEEIEAPGRPFAGRAVATIGDGERGREIFVPDKPGSSLKGRC